MASDRILHGLNDRQQEAVLHRDGPLLVLAGAGTGKTRTAIHRLAHLLQTGVAPTEVVCITFTNKAAREMRARATALVGAAAESVLIRTFHSAALLWLRESLPLYPAARRTPDFGIADPNTQLALVKEAIAERNFDLKANPPESFLWRIGRYKNELADPQTLLWRRPANPHLDWARVEAMIAATDRYVNRLTAEIWQRYEDKLAQNNLLDFDDLINLFVRLLDAVPTALARYQERCRYLQVDEFQDTNVAQLQMVKQLAGTGGNVLAVGDDSQSIYSWRSADLRCILEFEDHFPGARIVKLEQNYRSTGAILQAANRLIACNTTQRPKTLFTALDEGWPVTHHEAEDGDDEARWVVEQIRRHAPGRSYGDFAILYRTNVQSRPFEEHLRLAGLPYQVVGGPRFFDRREVADALAYLRVVDNPRDSVSLERVLAAPRRGIGEKAFHRLLGLASREEIDLVTALAVGADGGLFTGAAATGARELHSLLHGARTQLAAGAAWPAVAAGLLTDSGFLKALAHADQQADEHRADNVHSILALSQRHGHQRPGSTLRSFLELLALQDAQDAETGGDGVRLQTIHSAKGLEFPVVFVVGMEQGLLPNGRALDEGSLEEERRLCHVAFTRAQEVLYLTSARVRQGRGAFAVTVPSQFLQECRTGQVADPPVDAVVEPDADADADAAADADADAAAAARARVRSEPS